MTLAFASLDVKVRDIRLRANGPRFQDPEEEAEEVLAELRQMMVQLYELEKQMHELNRCRQMLAGFGGAGAGSGPGGSSPGLGVGGFSLENLTRTTAYLDLKFEIWKRYDEMSRMIDDWRRTQFRKMNFGKCLEKIRDWQQVILALRRRCENQDDPILAHQYAKLVELQQHFQLFLKLANPALKARHWAAIMAAIGEDASSLQDWLVGDLVALNLLHYAKQLNAIVHSALLERETEERLKKLALYWNEKELQLKKFIPRIHYLKGVHFLPHCTVRYAACPLHLNVHFMRFNGPPAG